MPSISVHGVRYAQPSKFIRLDSELFVATKESVTKRRMTERIVDFYQFSQNNAKHVTVASCGDAEFNSSSELQIFRA